jgi:hypothetical protein
VKYDNFTPKFIIDDGFEKYYLTVSDRTKLKMNVTRFFKDLYQEYMNNFNISADKRT